MALCFSDLWPHESFCLLYYQLFLVLCSSTPGPPTPFPPVHIFPPLSWSLFCPTTSTTQVCSHSYSCLFCYAYCILYICWNTALCASSEHTVPKKESGEQPGPSLCVYLSPNGSRMMECSDLEAESGMVYLNYCARGIVKCCIKNVATQWEL